MDPKSDDLESTPPAPEITLRDADAAEIQSKLTVWHVVAWFILIGFCLAFQRQVWEPTFNTEPLSLVEVKHALLAAASVGSLLIFIRRRLNGIPFPVEPGEWMLVVSGLQFIALPAINRIVAMNLADDQTVSYLAWTLLCTLPQILPIIFAKDLLLRIYFAVACAAVWCRFAVILLFWEDDSTLVLNAMGFYAALRLVLLAGLIARDLLNRQSRGRLHWTGIIVTALPDLDDLRNWLTWLIFGLSAF